MQTQAAFITVFIIHIKPVFVCGEELDQNRNHDDVIFWVPADTNKETFLLVIIFLYVCCPLETCYWPDLFHV